MSRRRSLVRPIAVGVGAAAVVAVLGSTITELGPWYRALRQPTWAPADWVFPVAWTTVYSFTVAAGVTAWRATESARARERLLGLFGLNAFLNILWSLIFFRLHRPDWALVEVAVFWLSIVLLIVVAARPSRPAQLMLVPYIAWVSVASVLNYEIVRLNGPFG